MKKVIFFSFLACTLVHNHACGMLFKRISSHKKYVRNTHNQKYNRSEYIHHLLREDPFKISDENNEDEETYQDEQSILKSIYFRDKAIINLLEEDIDDKRKKIKLLREQQDCALVGIDFHHTGEVEEIEKELRIMFEIKKHE